MELGIIGLGRMGANMTRRLLRGGQRCVVFDRSPDAVAALTKEKAAGVASLAELAKALAKPQRRELPAGWDSDLPRFAADGAGIAGREASGTVLNAAARRIPWLIGGAADLGPSTKTALKDAGDFEAETPGGRNLHFGVREHAMAAIANGLALSKLRPSTGTFAIFSDYARPAIRFAAIMELPVIFVLSHDAMGDGEDGPTHQPGVARGAYVMADAPGGPPKIVLIASGSEVALVVDAHETLTRQGIRSRVVSMPSWDIFEHRERAYRESVLPPAITARIAVEQGSVLGWDRYVGPAGQVIGMKTFGASAPLKELQRKFGFEPEHIVTAAREMLGRR